VLLVKISGCGGLMKTVKLKIREGGKKQFDGIEATLQS
jgi:hypothetical protein